MTESRNKQNNLSETFDYFEDGELREDLDEEKISWLNNFMVFTF